MTARTFPVQVEQAMEEPGASHVAANDEHEAPVVRRKLTLAQEQEMRELILSHTPDELGMPNGLWTKFVVRELVAARIGIKLPDTTLGVYLRRWGFVPEKALRKAYAQHPALIRHWVKHQYPLIAAQARSQNGEIHWWDERALEQAGPARSGSNIMVAMTSNRRLVNWMVIHGPPATRTLVEFFKRAIEETERKVFLIVPNDPLYVSKPVASWLASNADRLQLAQLPGEEDAATLRIHRGAGARERNRTPTDDDVIR